MILKLKLPYEPIDDVVFWYFDKYGVYYVKPRYSLAVQLRDSATVGSLVGVSKVWHLIWTLQVPPKVKIFLWLVLHDVLSTKVNLASCSLCGFSGKTFMQALFYCAFAQRVWRDTIFADLVFCDVSNNC